MGRSHDHWCPDCRSWVSGFDLVSDCCPGCGSPNIVYDENNEKGNPMTLRDDILKAIRTAFTDGEAADRIIDLIRERREQVALVIENEIHIRVANADQSVAFYADSMAAANAVIDLLCGEDDDE